MILMPESLIGKNVRIAVGNAMAIAAIEPGLPISKPLKAFKNPMRG